MPKRGIIASLLTAVGLVLLLSFKTPSETVPPSGTNAALRRPAVAPTPSDATPTPGSRSATTPEPTPTPAPQTADRTVTGPVIQTRYGGVQLQVTLSNGKITDITPLELPNDLQRSAYISSVAAPLLREEALHAQNAQIDLLSGATYTSEAYAESLQAVLDQTHG